jgi:hypothetical protein
MSNAKHVERCLARMKAQFAKAGGLYVLKPFRPLSPGTIDAGGR